MRYEARMKRIAKKLPQPRQEIIVSFLDEIFSTTKGWSIHVDENGIITKKGNVPASYTPEYIMARLPHAFPSREPKPASDDRTTQSQPTHAAPAPNPCLDTRDI